MARRDILFGWTAESLNGATTALRATEPYYAGAAIVIVLADLFGEGIHRELLLRPLNEILAAREARRWNVFKAIVKWADRHGAE